MSGVLAATAIQIATLVVALVAAFGALVAAIFSGIFTSRSEHRTWQRNLRQQIYGDSVKTGESYLFETTPDLFKYITRDDDSHVREEEDALVDAMIADADDLRRTVSDISSFGSRKVAASATLLLIQSVRLLNVVSDNGRTRSQMDEALDAARAAFRDHREAIRKSLRISDD
ncbi:MAG TPA: hypothetical protein VMF35_07565 [Acidimicrobiales bacterium]|nr:hypothetical protein [Acidimicrobiales bacterium]